MICTLSHLVLEKYPPIKKNSTFFNLFSLYNPIGSNSFMLSRKTHSVHSSSTLVLDIMQKKNETEKNKKMFIQCLYTVVT